MLYQTSMCVTGRLFVLTPTTGGCDCESFFILNSKDVVYLLLGPAMAESLPRGFVDQSKFFVLVPGVIDQPELVGISSNDGHENDATFGMGGDCVAWIGAGLNPDHPLATGSWGKELETRTGLIVVQNPLPGWRKAGVVFCGWLPHGKRTCRLSEA